MFDSWTRFEAEEFDDFRKLPADSGIYGVFGLNDKVLYIGKSVRLRSRWWASRSSFFFEPHKMTDNILEDGCYIKYKLMNKLEAAHLELDLISQVKPMHNIRTV